MAKIHIVDDSKTSRKILRSIVESVGHEVVKESVNGQEALDSFQEIPFDIMTMDITMPVKDGLQALKEIIKQAPKTKIIMITAAGQKTKMIEAVKFGAAEFVTKPFDEKSILATIERILMED